MQSDKQNSLSLGTGAREPLDLLVHLEKKLEEFVQFQEEQSGKGRLRLEGDKTK